MIGSGDQLDIKFPYRPDFDQTETVRPDGKISLALLNSIQAAGKTPEALTRQIRSAYRAMRARVPPPSKRAYLIQAGDGLDIRFTDTPQLNDQAIVLPDGRITLSMIGSVIAEGKTPEQLARELISRYAKFTTAPDLVVIVRTISSRQFLAGGHIEKSPVTDLEDASVVVRSFPPPRLYVGGEVLRPGELPYSGPISLLQAVFSAGGPTSAGELRSVVVIRRNPDNRPYVFVANVSNDLHGRAASDIPLRPFDVVYVPKTPIAKVQDFLDQYLYRVIPALRNSSVGFSYIITNQQILQ